MLWKKETELWERGTRSQGKTLWGGDILSWDLKWKAGPREQLEQRPRGGKELAIQGVNGLVHSVPEGEERRQRAWAESCWAQEATEEFGFFSRINEKPLKGFKQGSDMILKKTKAVNWRMDCKMWTGKGKYQLKGCYNILGELTVPWTRLWQWRQKQVNLWLHWSWDNGAW